MLTKCALLSVTVGLLLAVPASADVLVQAIPKRLVCGDAIVPGIWAQSWTTGNRFVRMKAIDRRTGRVWWRKRARALKSHWREWYLPSGMGGQMPEHDLRVPCCHGWKVTYRIRFRSEGV